MSSNRSWTMPGSFGDATLRRTAGMRYACRQQAFPADAQTQRT